MMFKCFKQILILFSLFFVFNGIKIEKELETEPRFHRNIFRANFVIFTKTRNYFWRKILFPFFRRSYFSNFALFSFCKSDKFFRI